LKIEHWNSKIYIAHSTFIIQHSTCNIEHWKLNNEYWILNIKHWILNNEYWILNIKHWKSNVHRWTLNIEHWTLSIQRFTFNIEYSRLNHLLEGIAYNSSIKGKCANTNEIGTTESTENSETAKIDDVSTEVENDKKVSFNNVTNVG